MTFGLPLYALASGLALRLLVLEVRRDRRPLLSAAGRVALALLPAIAAGLFQLWYNHARFGSPFEFAPLAAKGVESALHWSRMPSGALAYLRISPENFSLRVPFLTFAFPSVFRPELYLDLTNLVISPLLVSPWLVVGLVGGGMLPGPPGERRLLALCAVPFAVQCLLILAYYWLAYRFTTEFLPLAVWFLAAYLHKAGAGTGSGAAPVSAGVCARDGILRTGNGDVAVPLPESVVGVSGAVPPAHLPHVRGARRTARARRPRS